MGKLMQYVVIFEKSENGYSAYVPDLPVCVAVGDTLEEVCTLIAEAIEFHIEGLREEGAVIPPPSPLSDIQEDWRVSPQHLFPALIAAKV